MEMFGLGIMSINRDAVSVINAKTEEFFKEFPEVFTDKLGKYNKHKVVFKVNLDANPVFYNARPVSR